MLKIHKTKQENLFLQYTFWFFILALIGFSGFFLCHRTMIWNIDGYLQRYPVFVQFKNMIRDVCNGKGFSLWSQNVGLGSDTIGVFSFVLFDPFSYLMLFFSNKNLDIAYTLIVILKLYAAGMTTLIYLYYHKHSNALCMIGAMGYALCTWAMYFIHHDFFLSHMIYFPLLILGVDKVRKKESPLCFVFSVAISIAGNVYMAYMSAVFVVIYIVLRFWNLDVSKNLKTFWCYFWKYCIYAFIGVLLVMPVLTAGLYILANSGTGTGVEMQVLPNIKQILKYIPAWISNQDIHDNNTTVGTNMLFVAVIPAILFRKKKSASMKVFLLSMLFCFLPIFQRMFNAFSYATGRWCYAMIFFFSCLVVEILEEKEVFSKKYQKRFWAWYAILAGTTWLLILGTPLLSGANIIYAFVNLSFGGAIGWIFFTADMTVNKKQKMLEKIALANICILTMVRFSPFAGTEIYSYMEQGKTYGLYQQNNFKVEKKIQDNGFYRVDHVDDADKDGNKVSYAHTPANTSLYWGVPSVSSYFSVDKRWTDFNLLLGNSAGNYRRICVYSNDNRSRMDFLLGVKYFFGDDTTKNWNMSQYAGYGFSKQTQIDGVSVLQSKYQTGLGYVYNDVVGQKTIEKYSPLQKEQIMMQAAVLEDKDISSLKHIKNKRNFSVKENTTTYTITEQDGVQVSDRKIHVTKPNTSITIHVNSAIKNSELYVRWKGLKRTPFTFQKQYAFEHGSNATIGKVETIRHFFDGKQYDNFSIYLTKGDIYKRILNASGEAQGITNISEYTVNMGYVANENTSTIQCRFEQTGDYSFDAIEIVAVPQDDFDTQATALEQNRLKTKEYSADYITGTVNSTEGGLLYLSIPYNPGWSFWIDGKKVQNVYCTNGGFTGIEVEAGEHRIEMRYVTIGLPFSGIASVIGVMCVIGIVFYRGNGLKKGKGLQD